MTTRSEYQDGLRDRKLVGSGTFDFIRTAAELGFPALIALYIALSEAWNWAYQTEITATLVAANVFVGVLVKILRYRYDTSIQKYDGEMVVNLQDPMKDTFGLELTTSPADIPAKDELRLKVTEEK